MANSPFAIRTALARVRCLGAAHGGTEHFWRQRMTAVSNLLLVFPAVFIVARTAFSDRAGAVATLSHPLAALALLGFILSATTHMRMGVQIIIEDYIHDELLKVLAIFANTFFAISIALASAYAIFKINSGM